MWRRSDFADLIEGDGYGGIHQTAQDGTTEGDLVQKALFLRLTGKKAKDQGLKAVPAFVLGEQLSSGLLIVLHNLQKDMPAPDGGKIRYLRKLLLADFHGGHHGFRLIGHVVFLQGIIVALEKQIGGDGLVVLFLEKVFHIEKKSGFPVPL